MKSYQLERVDLNRLQVFKEVVLTGSFSRAAAKLRQPKSRISRHIAALEDELGVQLIFRTTRQFQLTQAGNELFQKATPLLNELANALEEVSLESDEVKGLLRVTVPEDVGTQLMGEWCAEFMSLYPKVQIGLHASNQIVDLVKDSIDVAIRMGRTKDSTMIQKKIGVLETVFVASPEFLKRAGGVARLERPDRLEELPFLAFSHPGQRLHTARVTNGKENRSLRLTSAFSSNNFFVLRAMALSGAGFTWLPAFLAREHLNSGALVRLVREWRFESTPVSILMPHQKETPLRVRKFIDFVTLRLQQSL